MCKLCNGTHVVHEVDGLSVGFSCCPTCGPEPKEIQQARMNEIRKKIREARDRNLELGA